MCRKRIVNLYLTISVYNDGKDLGAKKQETVMSTSVKHFDRMLQLDSDALVIAMVVQGGLDRQDRLGKERSPINDQ